MNDFYKKAKKRIALAISRNRKCIILKGINKLCKKYVKIYENNNNDLLTNGESFLLGMLRNQDRLVVFDVGANVGKWTLLAQQYLPTSMIFSFEPVPSTFEKLFENCKGKKNITCNLLGLSNINGRVEIIEDINNSLYSSSIYNRHHHSIKKNECTMRMGDSYCTDNMIERINVLKIDVEGAEPKVLEGFHGMLSKGKIDMIQFEYSSINIQTGFLLKDFYKLLEEYGYRIGKLYPNYIDFRNYDYSMEDFIGLNYVAVHRYNKLGLSVFF